MLPPGGRVLGRECRKLLWSLMGFGSPREPPGVSSPASRARGAPQPCAFSLASGWRWDRPALTEPRTDPRASENWVMWLKGDEVVLSHGAGGEGGSLVRILVSYLEHQCHWVFKCLFSPSTVRSWGVGRDSRGWLFR